MNKNIRRLFPAAQKYTYLNSAQFAPLPTTSVRAVTSQLTDASRNGSINTDDWQATKNRARRLVAEMLGVRAEHVAFMRNTSDGFSSVALGMNWKKRRQYRHFCPRISGEFLSVARAARPVRRRDSRLRRKKRAD